MNWNAFKRLFHYLGRYKLRLILVMIAAVLSTLFTVLTPAVTGGITSELYDGVASGSFDWETIVWLLVTLIALYLVAQLFAILQSFSMTKLTACVSRTFEVIGHSVCIDDETLAEAISALPVDRRDIILLSYFLDMSDAEIANVLNMVRRSVAYRRTSTLKLLKNLMGGENR